MENFWVVFFSFGTMFLCFGLGEDKAKKAAGWYVCAILWYIGAIYLAATNYTN